jgi:putative ABC transport system permease protein
MKTGRNFSVDMKTDSSAIIINEAAAQLLGFSNPINQLLYLPMDSKASVMKPFHIIGVIKDFNFKSLRENVTPLVLFDSEDTGALSIRINSTNIPGLLEQVKAKWKSISPNLQISYSFMDEDFDNNYRTEQRIGQIAI